MHIVFGLYLHAFSEQCLIAAKLNCKVLLFKTWKYCHKDVDYYSAHYAVSPNYNLWVLHEESSVCNKYAAYNI